MSPVTHLLVGWAFAQCTQLNRRERAVVTLASVAPDLDGVGLVVDAVAGTELWAAWHHVVGHGLLGALVVTAVAALVAKKRALTAAMAFVSFHLHIACDLVGARGPDGDQWPVHYLWPVNDDVRLVWSGQWALNAWPNFALTAVLLVFTLYVSWARGRSPLELVSLRADAALTAALRARFGRNAAP